jgi:RND family efflux transporter MFP subunit
MTDYDRNEVEPTAEDDHAPHADPPEAPRPSKGLLMLKGATRLVMCVAVLAGGVLLFTAFKSMKKPPSEVVPNERALRVEAITVQPEDVEVMLEGTGLVRALNSVRISPEVSGCVVKMHPRLEVGEEIAKGETLFVIDPRTYQAQVNQAKANVTQLETMVRRLKTQMTQDRARLSTLKRTRDLAKGEFIRVKSLLDKDQVGTQSMVDQTEQAYNAARDATDRLEQALVLYPIQIEEAQSSLAAASAGLELSQVNMSRTQVVAPFNARVQTVNLEVGQSIAPGAPVLTLADDSLMELSVPLRSGDARKWLRFDDASASADGGWFGKLEPVACTIRWMEGTAGHAWKGTVHRVEKFDPNTLTIWVAVRVEDKAAESTDQPDLPLVEGMFCSVEFPGRTITGAFRVPQWAVTFEDLVYVSEDLRLVRTPVKVGWARGDHAYVVEGLKAGDQVVTTRLVNPLTGILLEIESNNPQENAS